PRDGRAISGGVAHRHRLLASFAEAHAHARGAALSNAKAVGGEADSEGARGRHTVDGHIVDVPGDGLAVGVQRAEGPAVDFAESEAVGGGTITDLLAGEAVEGELQLAPAAKVIGEGDGVALGVVA